MPKIPVDNGSSLNKQITLRIIALIETKSFGGIWSFGEDSMGLYGGIWSFGEHSMRKYMGGRQIFETSQEVHKRGG
jgi:hypothetical protein